MFPRPMLLIGVTWARNYLLGVWETQKLCNNGPRSCPSCAQVAQAADGVVRGGCCRGRVYSQGPSRQPGGRLVLFHSPTRLRRMHWGPVTGVLQIIDISKDEVI